MPPRRKRRAPVDADQRDESNSAGIEALGAELRPASPLPSPPSPLPSIGHLATPVPASSAIPVPTQPSPPSSQPRNSDSQQLQGRAPWWTRDGTSTQPSSYEYLLQWLEIPGNPHKVLNGSEGLSRIAGCQECSDWLQAAGCPTHRNATQVQSQVSPPHRSTCKLISRFIPLKQPLTRPGHTSRRLVQVREAAP